MTNLTAPNAASTISGPTREADVRLAVNLTLLTIGWMLVEGGVSLWLGARSRSLLLEAFGIDSVIELISAFVVLWWLVAESRHGEAHGLAVERRAAKATAALLGGLCVYIAATALWALTHHPATDTHESAWGIVIGIVAKIGMPLLAAAKIRVADRLGSRALRADAMEAITCGYLSVALVVGLAISRVTGWPQVDALASLAIIPLLVKEAREAWTGECQCHSS
jgi:divalent metal cation (Fe/Co/Zn/Cd) transporter